MSTGVKAWGAGDLLLCPIATQASVAANEWREEMRYAQDMAQGIEKCRHGQDKRS